MRFRSQVSTRTPHWLANGTFLLAGYTIGDIAVTIFKLIPG